MNAKAVVSVYDLEAPGLEQSRLLPLKIVFLVPLCILFLIFISLLIAYHALSKRAGGPALTAGPPPMRISFRKMNQ